MHHNHPTPTPILPEDQPNVSTYLAEASHRISTEHERDLGNQPLYCHDRAEPIPANTTVRLKIPMWPMGMVFAAGEGIMLRVLGHSNHQPETEDLSLTEPEDHNPKVVYILLIQVGSMIASTEYPSGIHKIKC